MSGLTGEDRLELWPQIALDHGRRIDVEELLGACVRTENIRI